MAARKRPGFERQNTDQIPLENMDDNKSATGPSSSEFHDPEAKDGGVVEVTNYKTSEEFDPERENVDQDGFAVVTEPVQDANDLVTQVIHVDDDPSINPVTFRTFFLGRLFSAATLAPLCKKLRFMGGER